jgi:ABC-type sugar transport system ATPase subunit
MLMQFGGLKALNQVDLNVARGSVHGLIGPNGSGKSTMMNVLTGIYKPTAGGVVFAGQPITGRTPSQIALGGIARTFQNVQLFGEMTATENVLVGLHHTFRSTVFDAMLSHAALPPRGSGGAQAGGGHPRIRRPVRPGRRGSAQPPLRQAAPARDRPRAGPRTRAAAARRTGRRPDRARTSAS